MPASRTPAPLASPRRKNGPKVPKVTVSHGDATADQQILILPDITATLPQSPTKGSEVKTHRLPDWHDATNLPRIELDENALDSVPDQIRHQLGEQMTRVIDLFKACDSDESGDINRKEFCLALKLCGLEKEDAMNVFDCFDLDRSGSIEYTELSNIIRRSKTIHPRLSARQRALLPVETEKVPLGTWTRYTRPQPRTPKNTADPYTLVELGSSKWLPPKATLLAWERTIGGWGSTDRSSNKLAIVALPALEHETLSDPIFTGSTFTLRQGQHVQRLPSGVLRSPLLLRHLTDDGYNILAYESHSPAAQWEEAGEAATAHLLTVLDYVASHPSLRYCRIAHFAQGVGATAAFVASYRAPSTFENRLKVIVACEPKEEAELLSKHVPHCSVPVLLLSRAGSELCDDIYGALTQRIRNLSNWIRVEGDHQQHSEQDFDCSRFLSDEPGAVLPFLQAHVNVGRDPATLLSPRALSPRLSSSTKTFHLPPLRSPRDAGGTTPRMIS